MRICNIFACIYLNYAFPFLYVTPGSKSSFSCGFTSNAPLRTSRSKYIFFAKTIRVLLRSRIIQSIILRLETRRDIVLTGNEINPEGA